MRRKFMTSSNEDKDSYWVIFDESQSTTVLEQGGNVGVRDAIRSKFKRCMAMPRYHETGNNKAVIAYLNENDSTKWPDGSAVSEISTNRGGKYIMVHFPTYYYRNEDLGNNRYKLYVSDIKVNNNYKEERECLVGVFEGYRDNTLLTSWTGVLSSGYDLIENFYDCAKANGSNWGLIDYRAHKTIANMFCIMYGNTNISTLNSDIPCSGGTRLYGDRVGGTISLGNRDGRGAVPNSNYYSSNLLGVEDCYCGKMEFVQGINIITDYKWVVYDGGLSFNKTEDQLIKEGFTNVRTIGTAPSTSGSWITKIKHGEYADVMPISDSGGSDTTYYSDFYFCNIGERLFVRSGNSSNGSGCGVFMCNALNLSSTRDSTIGARLAFYGPIEIVSSDVFKSLTPQFGDNSGSGGSN